MLWGWRRLVAGFVAGAASALAFAPYNLFPVLWLTLPVLVWLIDGAVAPDGAGLFRRLLPAASAGWAFGFGFFVAGLWWVGAALLVDAEAFAWAMPLAVLVLPAGLALFFAVAAALARLFWPEGWLRVLVLAVAFAAAEWLRGHVLTGFPWNAFGYALTPTPLMMQSAALVGLWGLTLGAFIIFAAPAVLSDDAYRHSRGRNVFLALVTVLFLGHLAYGGLRLSVATEATVPDLHIRIVQPSIIQSEKWQIENADAIFKRYLEMSSSAIGRDGGGEVGATLLIWPESAFPFLLTTRPDALAAIAALLPPGTTLLSGAARAEASPGADPYGRVFNSIYVINDDAEIIGAYDKVDLVPFGEFLPFQGALESIGIRQLTDIPGGFSAGPRRRTLRLAVAPPAGPLICYEIIFPGSVVDSGSRPGWLLNLTNDAWFGNTPGPRQHFLQARVRAVEEGLPLVRGANSGISAIVDAYGRVWERLDLGEIGVLDGELPVSRPPTLYARLGDWIFVILLAVTGALILVGRFTLTLKHN